MENKVAEGLEKFAVNMKKIREEKGMTLEEVAQQMGKSVQMIKMWEYGNVWKVSTIEIMELARILDVTPAKLMGWEE